MALDDAFQESIEISLQNRAQLSALSEGTQSAHNVSATSALPLDSAEWIAIALMWFIALGLFFVLRRTSRHSWGTGLKWTRIALLTWMAVSMFGSLVSIRHGDTVYTTWLLLSCWPAPAGLMVFSIKKLFLIRRSRAHERATLGG